jgi:hypothetical protein
MWLQHLPIPATERSKARVVATRLMGVRVRIPPEAHMSFFGECCVPRWRFHLRADPSSRGVLPTAVCHFVWYRNLKNDALGYCARGEGVTSDRFSILTLSILWTQFESRPWSVFINKATQEWRILQLIINSDWIVVFVCILDAILRFHICLGGLEGVTQISGAGSLFFMQTLHNRIVKSFLCNICFV